MIKALEKRNSKKIAQEETARVYEQVRVFEQDSQQLLKDNIILGSLLTDTNGLGSIDYSNSSKLQYFKEI